MELVSSAPFPDTTDTAYTLPPTACLCSSLLVEDTLGHRVQTAHRDGSSLQGHHNPQVRGYNVAQRTASPVVAELREMGHHYKGIITLRSEDTMRLRLRASPVMAELIWMAQDLKVTTIPLPVTLNQEVHDGPLL